MRPNDDLAHEGVAMAVTIERPRMRGGKSSYRVRLPVFHRLAGKRKEVTGAKVIVKLCLYFAAASNYIKYLRGSVSPQTTN